MNVHLEDEHRLALTNTQAQALDMVLTLNEGVEQALRRLLYEDYLEASEVVTPETLGATLQSEAEAWDKNRPGAVFVLIPFHGNSRHLFAILSLQVPWSPDHGVNILIKDGLAVERVDADLGTSYYEWREYIAD